MKKRIISATLSLAMVIAIIASLCIPSSAFGPNLNLALFRVCGVDLTEKNYTPSAGALNSYLKEGEIEVSGNTITLKNATINASNNDVFSAISLINLDYFHQAKIVLEGNNKIICSNNSKLTPIPTHALCLFGVPVEISGNGSGSLTITGNDIYAAGLDINNCNLNVDNQTGIFGIVSNLCPTNILPSEYVDIGSIGIYNSNVNVLGGKYGIFTSFSEINVSGKSYVKATSMTSDSQSFTGAAIASTTVCADFSGTGLINVNNLPIKADGKEGKIVKLTKNALCDPLDIFKIYVDYGQTIATSDKTSAGALLNPFVGAAKVVEIGTAPVIVTPEKKPDTVVDNGETPHAAAPVAANTNTVATTPTPKAAAIADTGESAIIIPVVAIIAVASVGAITFILRKKVTE